MVPGMYQVESYLRVRRTVMVEGMSIREASRVFGLHRDTVMTWREALPSTSTNIRRSSGDTPSP